MMVKQFRYSMDNFGYVIYGNESALAIDGGAVDAIVSFLKEQQVQLIYVANTHGHQDHTMGTQTLVDKFSATYLDNARLRNEGTIDLEDTAVHVYHTPGHTADSVTFHVNKTLIAGDTLFNATVGNCFSGDLRGFYDSIKQLLALPDDTIVYAGHDYVRDSLAFVRMVEPDNPDLERYAENYDPSHVWSTLGDERKVNPFLRFNEPTIISYLKKKGLPVETEYERWESVMSL